jgi:hypothetical protein
VVDRAFIDASFWEAKKRARQITIITRMTSKRCVDATEGRPLTADPANEGVLQDLRVTLWSSREE